MLYGAHILHSSADFGLMDSIFMVNVVDIVPYLHVYDYI